MSQTKAQLISDLVQALNFTGTSSAPANGVYLSATNTIKLATNSLPRITIGSNGETTFAHAVNISSATDQLLNLNSSDSNATYLAFKRGGTRVSYFGYGGSGNTLTWANEISDGDIHLSVNDGGSTITPLKIDASEGGIVQLLVSGTTRLATSSTGVTITGTCTATSFAGALTTAAQTNITSVGTLTNLQIANNLGLGVAGSAFGSGVKTILLQGGSSTKSGCIDFKEYSSGTGLANIFAQNDTTYGLSIGTRCNGEDGDFIRFHTGTLGGTKMYIKSDGKVGIGTTSPSKKLHIDTTGTSGEGILLKSTNSYYPAIIGDADRSGAGLFLLALQGYWNGNRVSEVTCESGPDTTNKDDGIIVFRTRNHGDTTPQDRVTVDEAGNVGINTTSMTGRLNVQGNAGGIALQTTDATNSTFRISHPSNSVTLLAGGSNQNLALGTGFSEKIRIDTNGNLGIGTSNPSKLLDVEKAYGGNYVAHFRNGTSGTPYTVQIEEPNSPTPGYPLLNVCSDGGTTQYFRVDSGRGVTALKMHAGAGIDFSATSDATGKTSELLDDYEEGTWSPSIQGGTNGGSLSNQSVAGHYTKIGREVRAYFAITNFTLASASGNLQIINLPFQTNSPLGDWGANTFGWYNLDMPNNMSGAPILYVGDNQTYVTGLYFTDNGSWGGLPITNSSSMYVKGCIAYTAD